MFLQDLCSVDLLNLLLYALYRRVKTQISTVPCSIVYIEFTYNIITPNRTSKCDRLNFKNLTE